MVDSRIESWREIEDEISQIYVEELSLLDEMIESVKNNYQSNRMTPFRLLCFGILIICRDNAKAGLLLIKQDLIHQVHYISRNMFEMIVNLCFIDNEESKRGELVERFFDYGIVNGFKTLNKMNKYPLIPQSERTEQRDRDIENGYNHYKNKYKDVKGKVNLKTWSGKTLPEMIKCVKDPKLCENLMTGYDIMNETNNLFLHLSNEYVRTVIKGEFEGVTDYQMRYTQLSSLMLSADLIIKKYFIHFQKNRPAFRRKYDDIERRLDQIAAEAKKIVEKK
jgi:hypothetical protein